MKLGQAAIQLCGLVPAHAPAFQQTADGNDAIIVSRSLKPVCTGLLIEGYAAKGFDIKAKTCDWGPMAGFVVKSPLYSKMHIDEEIQNMISFVKGAGYRRICISTSRIADLCELHAIHLVNGDVTCKLVRAVAVGSPLIGSSRFMLIQENPPIEPKWGIYCLPAGVPTQASLDELRNHARKHPVIGMTNGRGGSNDASGRKLTVTGDYDLFAIYPKAFISKSSGKREKHWKQQRPVAHIPATVPKTAGSFVQKQAAKIVGKTDTKREVPHLGNITLLGRKIRDELNVRIQQAGYSGGNLVHHSDETGNPYSKAPDWPVIAFRPHQYPVALENVQDFRQFYKDAGAAGYDVQLNPRWRIRFF